MKILSLKLDLSNVTLGEEEKKSTPQQLASVIFKNLILGWANQNKGLKEEDRRKFYKIGDAFDKAIKEEKDSVELEDDWFGFLKKCKSEVQIMPNNLIRAAEDLINAVEQR